MSNQIEPGYCIANTPGSLSNQAKILFGNADSANARYFLQLNADTPYVLPGQLLIIADSNSNQAAPLQHLRKAKDKVNHSMKFMSSDLALFMVKHHDQINTIINYSSNGIDYSVEAGTKYFEQIGAILKKIERLYQDEFTRSGKIASQQFYYQRAALFAELKSLINRPLLKNIAPKILNMLPYSKLARALGLSTQSIVHQWSSAGAAGAIRGYAERVEASAKAVKFLKAGGYITLALGALSTTNDVVQACSQGRENECRSVALTSYGGFAGSTYFGALGGSSGAALASSVCVAAGVATGGLGLVVCGIGGAAAGGALGGYGGNYIGSEAGKIVNNAVGWILVD